MSSALAIIEKTPVKPAQKACEKHVVHIGGHFATKPAKAWKDNSDSYYDNLSK